MRRLFAFIMTSLDGHHADLDGGIDWANAGDDLLAYSVSQLNDAGALLLGRTTYEGMASYWPGPGVTDAPEIAERMNALPKVVASTSLRDVGWDPTTVADGVAAAAELKAGAGGDVAVLGSSILTAQLLAAGLVDEVRVMVSPVLLGAGHTVFAGLPTTVPLALRRTTAFSSGNVLLVYEPAARATS